MPKRTNLFQEVVGIVHRHLAEGLLVQESEELVDRLDQDQREVDTTIRAMVAGYELVVSVEANARKRKADRTWVEQHVAKHQTLATNLLILVSEAGFTKPALGVAERAGALTVSPETLEEANPDYLIVTRLNSLWAKSSPPDPRESRSHAGGARRVSDSGANACGPRGTSDLSRGRSRGGHVTRGCAGIPPDKSVPDPPATENFAISARIRMQLSNWPSTTPARVPAARAYLSNGTARRRPRADSYSDTRSRGRHFIPRRRGSADAPKVWPR